MAISNNDNIINSLDIIEQLDSLETDLESQLFYGEIEDEDSFEDIEELRMLHEIDKQGAKECLVWESGTILYRFDYFTEDNIRRILTKSKMVDCNFFYDLPAVIEENINWHKVVEDMKDMFFIEIDFDSVPYYCAYDF